MKSRMLGLLEPALVTELDDMQVAQLTLTPAEAIALSSAISLKRIADRMVTLVEHIESIRRRGMPA